jgi:trimethylamine:corrinoid methyltransferase-like protein
LEHPHTAANFRKEFWIPDLMERMPWGVWNEQNLKGLEAKARARAHEILANHHPQPLSVEQMGVIDEIVEEARRDPWYRAG